MELIEVQFLKMAEQCRMPTQGYAGDAGYDLYSSRNATIPPHDFVDVHTDIAIALPFGYWARITGRSSTVRKWKLQVQEAVIDSGFRGELFTGIWNLTDVPITVPIGTRLAQLIVHPIQSVSWVETVDKLPDSNRGARGFGSSGQ